MTLDISDVTICMHLRVDSPVRLENVLAILKFLTKNIKTNIIVMESDTIQHGKVLSEMNTITYIYVQDHDPVFHFTKYRNNLIRIASTPIVALWDVDAVAPLHQLHEAIKKIRHQEAVIAWPYDGICYNVPLKTAKLFRDSGEMKLLTSHTKDFKPLFGGLNTGGIFFANRNKYMEIGMDNEYLRGWGPEDAERLKRITILGLPVYRVRGDLYHLWHPRGNNSGYIDPNRTIESFKEYLKVCRCSRE